MISGNDRKASANFPRHKNGTKRHKTPRQFLIQSALLSRVTADTSAAAYPRGATGVP
jgi:hypothetical protein